MGESSKRPLLQLHLSTCVILMFVAGGIIWCNVRFYHDWAWGYGWPCMFYIPGSGSSKWNSVDFILLGVNLGSAFTLLLCVAGVSEALIRRNELNQEFCELQLRKRQGKRRWFQIHISTAVACLLLLLLVLVLNLCPKGHPFFSRAEFGWPLAYYVDEGSDRYSWHWILSGLFADLVFWAAFVIGSGIILERRLRKKEKMHLNQSR